jgi:hypothetical protein
MPENISTQNHGESVTGKRWGAGIDQFYHEEHKGHKEEMKNAKRLMQNEK